MRLFFARLDEKHDLFESFEKIFENFPKISSENCEKVLILKYFSKNLTDHG